VDCDRCTFQHDPTKCTAHVDLEDGTRRPCQKLPMKGQRTCRSHGGAARHSRAKAAERLAEADAAATVAKFGWEPISNPYEVLADLLGEIVAFKDYLRGKVDELDRLVTFGEGGEQVKGVLGAYERALDRSLKAAGDIGKLDLSARALQFEQAVSAAEAAWLGGVLESVLVEAGLTSQVVSVVLAGLGRRLAQGEIAG
jgi:hypothetical protein